MAYEVRNLTCPGCGAPIQVGDRKCRFCRRPIYIESFKSLNRMNRSDLRHLAAGYKKNLSAAPDEPGMNSSAGMCWLEMGLYDQAENAFRRAIEKNYDNSETYFYAAVCLLHGESPFVRSKREVDQALGYMQGAVSLEGRGIYYYFMAYLVYEFYTRKMLRSHVSWQAYLEEAQRAGVSYEDLNDLHELLHTRIPDIFIG